MVAKGYSLYQFLAIASHIAPNARLGDMAYNALIAIQSSAFLMTLYRKRIIKGRTHMAIYGFCLVLSAFHIFRSMGVTHTLMCIAAFLARTNLPHAISNKYVVWSAFLVAIYWEHVDWAHLYSQIMEVPALQGSTLALSVYVAFSGERLLFAKDPSKLSASVSTDSLVSTGSYGSTDKLNEKDE